MNKTVFAGILKVVLGGHIEELRAVSLPAEAVLLPEEKWHITLCHQSFLKPYRAELKRLSKEGGFPSPPRVVLSKVPEVQASADLGRKSWVLWVENQEEIREYLNTLLGLVGCEPNPEPDRAFHVSLANLTGLPGDSVCAVKRKVWSGPGAPNHSGPGGQCLYCPYIGPYVLEYGEGWPSCPGCGAS